MKTPPTALVTGFLLGLGPIRVQFHFSAMADLSAFKSHTVMATSG